MAGPFKQTISHERISAYRILSPAQQAALRRQGPRRPPPSPSAGPCGAEPAPKPRSPLPALASIDS